MMYGGPRDGGRIDVWVSPIAGGTPRMLVPDAESPAAVAAVAPAGPVHPRRLSRPLNRRRACHTRRRPTPAACWPT